jgi:glycolate oxidase FAD binding subunit
MVVSPRVESPESTAEAAALIRATGDLAVLVRGGGSALDWGPPARRTDLIIDTSRLTGIVEHAAGDLITVVRAGTPMAELDLGDQQLALDARPGATVGGTVAVNASGPRRMLYGTARDLLIGITVVRPDGTVARAGGKVVKNVAGYDLGKLFIGSYGTLGLITECVFRLHPRPAAAATVTATAGDVGGAVAAVLAERVVPSALEVDAPPDGPVTVAVLLEGTAAGVRDRAARLAKVLDGEVADTPPAWWGTDPWRPGDLGLKLTVALSGVSGLLAAAGATGVPLTLRGSAGTGVLYAGLPGPTRETAAAVVTTMRAAAEHAIVLTAPPAVRNAVDWWGPVAGLALMRRVKEQFDPGYRFAPGRFVGGI